MHIRINVFPGIQNIPNFAAEHKGFFAAHGLQVETKSTTSSQEQRSDLANGVCDLAHSAVDNALALADAGVDTVIVLGLDRGFNKLVVRPEISSYEQLRGKTFGVDAPDTAFALLAYEVLREQGLERDRDYTVRKIGATGFRLQSLKEGTIDFAMLNLPFNLLAQEAGLKLLADPLDTVGAYQANGAFVVRDWAQRHQDTLTHYILGYVEGLRWALLPANKDEVIGLLQSRFQLSLELAAKCYEQICDPTRGFIADGRVDRLGMARVVALREAFSPRPDKVRRNPEVYVDESFYSHALSVQ